MKVSISAYSLFILCGLGLLSVPNASAATIKSKPIGITTIIFLLAGVAAYYAWKKPGKVEPVRTDALLMEKIHYYLDCIFGDMGEEKEIKEVDLKTGKVIYEKKDARNLGWYIKTFNKKILPVLTVGTLLFKTRDDINAGWKNFIGTANGSLFKGTPAAK